MANAAYNDSKYKRARRQLLTPDARCVIGYKCCKGRANTLDHILPIQFGGTNDLDNLRPACSACNSRRGSVLARQATLAQQGKRAKAMAQPKAAKIAELRSPALKEATVIPLRAVNGSRGKSKSKPPSPEVSWSANPEDPAASSSMYPTTRRRSRRKKVDDDSNIGIGRDEPRIITPLPGGCSSYGPAVAKWALREMNTVFMPWQDIACDHALAFDPANDRFCHREHLSSTARQNGKTLILKAICGWLLTDYAELLGRPVTVVLTAHSLQLASLDFAAIAPILERFGGDIGWSYGRQRVDMPDGSQLLVQAATAAAGHGLTIDVLLLDELWDVSEVAYDNGFLPAMRARPNAIALAFSTAGTEASTVMLRHRERAMRSADKGEPGRVGLCEWSPPPGVDVLGEKRWWRWSNPALGRTIELSTLEDEAEAPDRQAFMRAALNMFVASDKAWIEANVWPALAADFPALEGGILACDNSTDGKRWSAVRALTVDAVTRVEVSGIFDTEPDLWSHINGVMEDRQVGLVLSPTLEVHVPEQWKERYVTAGFGELTKWTSMVRAAVYDSRVIHRGQTMLSEHIARAVGVSTQAGYTLSSVKSPGPIELARLLVWAVALASRPVQPKRKPAMGAG